MGPSQPPARRYPTYVAFAARPSSATATAVVPPLCRSVASPDTPESRSGARRTSAARDDAGIAPTLVKPGFSPRMSLVGVVVGSAVGGACATEGLAGPASSTRQIPRPAASAYGGPLSA